MLQIGTGGSERGKQGKESQAHQIYKKFQCQKAINSVKKDEIVFLIKDELVDKNTLKMALFNEYQNSLINILKLIKEKIHNPS